MRLLLQGCHGGIVTMASETPLFVLHVIGLAGVLWLGFYVLARGQRAAVSVLTGAAVLSAALFFLYGCMEEALHDGPVGVWLAFDRFGWICDVLPITLWLHLTLCLNPRAAAVPWRRPVLWANYVAAAVITVLGSGTNLVRDHIGFLHDPTGPLFWLYTSYLLICMAFAAFNLVAFTRGTRPSQDIAAPPTQAPVSPLEERLLLGSAVCFLVAAGYESVHEMLHVEWSRPRSWTQGRAAPAAL